MRVRWMFRWCWGVVWLSLVFIAVLFPSTGVISSDYFITDSLSMYLSVLVLILGLTAIFFNKSRLSRTTKSFLLSRLVFSLLCFFTNNAILFWCFYELAMLPLLCLIFRDSPYSERYLAGWYFSCYLLITRLPLILVIVYLGCIHGGYTISSWTTNRVPTLVFVLLSFIFFTKVPLCPFHTWLPIVHAEATSIVSTFLSGYIMKLGLVGVYRFSGICLSDRLFGFLVVCCIMRILFLISASSELDGKRWLALLRLSHIVVPFLGLFVCRWDLSSVIFLYSLGHGLSAAIVFGLLWMFYSITNTRKWILLKGGIRGTVIVLLTSISLLSLCSFPPTIQFFSEVSLLTLSYFSCSYLVFWGFYLFLGGVVPLVLCARSLLRAESVERCDDLNKYFGRYLSLLVIWCYLGVFIV